MNIGYQLQPGDNGIPDDWHVPADSDTPFSDAVENWLEETSYHRLADRVRTLAADQVAESYADGTRRFKL
jgi:hypothetical protein